MRVEQVNQRMIFFRGGKDSKTGKLSDLDFVNYLERANNRAQLRVEREKRGGGGGRKKDQRMV